MAVVKANAYGHGLIECARALERECGVDYFGVALVEEGVRLRQAGIKAPILIFGGIFTDQVGIYLEHDLDLTASSVEKLGLIEGAAKALGKRARIHIKIDTGMGRIGVRPSSAPAVFEAAHASAHCDLVGVFTHFATADEEDLTFTRKQLKDFTNCLSCFQEKGSLFPYDTRRILAPFCSFPRAIWTWCAAAFLFLESLPPSTLTLRLLSWLNR
jgi:alanine racemase